MMYRPFTGCLLAYLVFIVPAFAGETLTGAQLVERRCQTLIESPQEPADEVCVAFVQGYLAGLKAAERPPAAEGVAQHESFAERAARTRARGHLQRFRTLQGREYCVPDDTSGAEAIQRITAYLGAYLRDRDARGNAVELVHQALTQTFPCNNND